MHAVLAIGQDHSVGVDQLFPLSDQGTFQCNRRAHMMYKYMLIDVTLPSATLIERAIKTGYGGKRGNDHRALSLSKCFRTQAARTSRKRPTSLEEAEVATALRLGGGRAGREESRTRRNNRARRKSRTRRRMLRQRIMV
jgi:hypothetical protein